MFFVTTEFDRQGGPIVLKSYELIKQIIPGLKLIIGGRCPVYVPEGVTLYKNLTQDIMENLFNKVLIFLMPGVLGGLQSVLQAMSKKCVCIVGDSNVLLAHVVKNNETGFVIPTNNPDKLAEKIVELYQDESLMKEIANQACDYVNENFTWNKGVDKMTQHFTS